MKPKILPAVALALISATAQAGNYAGCLLSKLPGTENDIAANAIQKMCLSDYPAGIEGVQQGSGRGVFGFDSGAACTAKKAASTRSVRAAFLIGACV